jgi:hypothetical protein
MADSPESARKLVEDLGATSFFFTDEFKKIPSEETNESGSTGLLGARREERYKILLFHSHYSTCLDFLTSVR